VKHLLAFVVVAVLATAPGQSSSDSSTMSIVWQKVQTTATGGQYPGWIGYTKPVYDPISGTTLWYNSRTTSTTIYSTDFFSYRAATRTWTRLGGTGSLAATCGDGSTSTGVNGSPIVPWPSDRHPIEQLTIDTLRRRLYIAGGVCMNVTPNDTWYYTLNSDPTLNRWTKVSISKVPTVQVSGSMEYSPTDDVVVMHGANSGNWPRTWVLCPASQGAALSPTQTAAGCTVPNDWAETYAPNTVDPPQSYFGSLVHVPGTGKMFHFGHNGTRGEVWAYDIPTRSWSNRNPPGQPSEPNHFEAPERLVAHISSGGLSAKVFYHQTSHSSTTGLAADWIYDPAVNAWTALSTSGIGPQKLTYLAFDPSLGTHGTIVAYSFDGGLWHGTFQAGGGTVTPPPAAPSNLYIVR
jgi:hypothetical protein